MPLNFLKDPVRSQLIENEYEKSLERAFDEALPRSFRPVVGL